jgi:hypothetical protein
MPKRHWECQHLKVESKKVDGQACNLGRARNTPSEKQHHLNFHHQAKPGGQWANKGSLMYRTIKKLFTVRSIPSSWAPVAYTCNPSYLGGRDQEDHSLKPALANNSWKYLTWKRLVEWFKVQALSSSPSNVQKKKKQKQKHPHNIGFWHSPSHT